MSCFIIRLLNLKRNLGKGLQMRITLPHLHTLYLGWQLYCEEWPETALHPKE